MESRPRIDVRCVVWRRFGDVEQGNLRMYRRGIDDLGLRRFNDVISDSIDRDVSIEPGDLDIQMTGSAG